MLCNAREKERTQTQILDTTHIYLSLTLCYKLALQTMAVVIIIVRCVKRNQRYNFSQRVVDIYYIVLVL